MSAGTDPSRPLAGLHCLVLRPRGQAEALSGCLRERGARVTHCPTIAIEYRAVPADELARLAAADWLVFISPNAVKAALEAAGRSLPTGPAVAAVGGATATTLSEAGVAVDAAPDSGGGGAALLRHPRLQDLAGARVIIVRGEGGCEHLAEELAARGARVEYLEVYRRVLPAVAEPGRLLAGWRASRARVTIATSVTGWQNLLTLADSESRPAILGGALVAVSGRVRDAARGDGHRGPAVISDDPGAVALADAAGEALRQITETEQ